MNTRALYPPPNYERLLQDEIPHDVTHFESWVSFACVEFPTYLEKLARLALDELQGSYKFTPGAFQHFITKYGEWLALSEDEKLHRMEPARAASPWRDYARRRTRHAARTAYTGTNYTENADGR